MNMNEATDWEERLAATWASIGDRSEHEFLAAIDGLAAELSEGSAIAAFERACAQDSTGHSDRAVPLYGQALAAGLDGIRRRRAVIQLASSLRNLGHPEESIELLQAERREPSDALDDAVVAFLALALADRGPPARAREGLAIALTALAPHLPRYQRSPAGYAQDLAGESDVPASPT
jgi:tetratricopeptide (TPR) repeat protein